MYCDLDEAVNWRRFTVARRHSTIGYPLSYMLASNHASPRNVSPNREPVIDSNIMMNCECWIYEVGLLRSKLSPGIEPGSGWPLLRRVTGSNVVPLHGGTTAQIIKGDGRSRSRHFRRSYPKEKNNITVHIQNLIGNMKIRIKRVHR